LHFTGFEFVENSLLSDNPFQKRWILTGQTTLFGKKPPQGFKDEDKARLTYVLCLCFVFVLCLFYFILFYFTLFYFILIYFNLFYFILFYFSEENDSTTIKEGKYTWPFSFTIPSKIPPSAEYKNGKIKIEYNLVALVEIPWSKGKLFVCLFVCFVCLFCFVCLIIEMQNDDIYIILKFQNLKFFSF